MSRVSKFIGPLIIIICTGVLFLISLAFDTRDGLWPQGIIIALFLLCITLMATRSREKKSENKSHQEVGAGSFKVLGAILTTTVYLFICEWVGYYICTVFFILTLLLLFGERNRIVLSTLPIITTIVIYAVFFLFLHIPLPTGLFF